ncbi:MAG: hypothetical protein ACFE0J_04865 [Elainellaceae cyanobacterium]
MKRGDRRNDNYDNSVRNPHGRQVEPVSAHESKQLIMTLRAQKTELQQQVQQTEQQAEQNHHLYLEEQQRYQSTLTLYREAETQAQSYLALYDQEKARSGELLVKFETVQMERDQYITLYNEAQSQLKYERRSKAGIKGWETRRKRENERLKQEISEMTVLLRDSLTRRDAAITNLEELATRMDRIHSLVNSVENDSTDNPIGLLQKFKRIWHAIQDILAE